MSDYIAAAECRDCERPARIRGWCRMHYKRWKKWGDPSFVLNRRNATPADFWARVGPPLPSGCREWVGWRSRGYGMVYWEGKDQAAHRVSWKLTHGDPGKLWVLHRCDNPPCCEPSHLFLGTHQDNVGDKMTKGRHRGPRGTRCAQHRLTEVDVIQIRALLAAGEQQRHIAQQFNVSTSAIQHIVKGRTWGWLK